MNDLLVEILNTYGYLGIAFLIMIENIFPPIPSEVILTFSGFMTTFTQMNLPGVVVSATVGSLAGAIFLYELGSVLSMEKIQSLVNGPVGKALHLDIHDIEKAISWFDSKGNYTVFLCRFIPIVRSLISIPAGIAQMRLGPFFLMTTLGSLLWNFILIFLVLPQVPPGKKQYSISTTILRLPKLSLFYSPLWDFSFSCAVSLKRRLQLNKLLNISRSCSAAASHKICSGIYETFDMTCKFFCSHRIHRISHGINHRISGIWLYD